MLRQIILDTETTGLSPEEGHRIIEIGCLEMINRRITDNHYHCYINPERDIDQGALNVHGITEEFLGDKPVFSDIADEFIAYIDGAELIIHNAPFDVGFVNHELKLLKKGFKKVQDYCSVIDTLTYARRKHPGQHNSLDALCRRYEVDNSNRDLHGALLDAELLAQVYLRMTGGQTRMFETDSIEKSAETTAQQACRIASDRDPLRIIEPTAEEIKAHQAFLEILKKQSGHCVWEDGSL